MVPEQTILRLSREAAEGSKILSGREAARLTGGVPVYADMGGVFVVFGDGRVLSLEHDTTNVRPVEDPVWRMVALVSAAKKFPELAALMPERPPNAVTCPDCGGSGVRFAKNLICGTCHYSGWVNPQKEAEERPNRKPDHT